MTATLASTGTSGHTATVLAFMLSLSHPDSAQRRRIRALVGELDEIHDDRAMAARMNPETTRRWLRELADEERATWRALRALTAELNQQEEARS